MKKRSINKGAFISFCISFFLVGITSYNITQDYIMAISQGTVAGFSFTFFYIVGYLNGTNEGKSIGYENAMKDIKPILPPEIETDKK